MFEYLESFSRIIVTGPQRSGTTIVARAIEHDLGRQYIDEQAFSAIDYFKFVFLVALADNFVMQAPGMCRFVHEVGIDNDIAVVTCRRNIDDIVASQERVGWQWEAFELSRYKIYQDDIPVSVVKYAFWDDVQKGMIPNAFDVDYESLRAHPLWIGKEQGRISTNGNGR